MIVNRAKIFKTGNSQAARLPKGFRLATKSVVITHLGDAIVLQPVKETWQDVYLAMAELKSFLEERDDRTAVEREVF